MKVVGIGFGKTGTSTLAACLEALGFRHKTWDRSLYDAWARGDMSAVDAALDSHDSFDDWPWPGVYRYVDALHPGTRFVLTVRQDVETFVNSLATHVERRADKTRMWHAYGMTAGRFDAEQARRRYFKHIEQVREYFRDRPGDLLEVCWERGDGWSQLAPFLGRPVPSLPFPHAYATPTAESYSQQERLRRWIPRFVRKGLGMRPRTR